MRKFINFNKSQHGIGLALQPTVSILNTSWMFPHDHAAYAHAHGRRRRASSERGLVCLVAQGHNNMCCLIIIKTFIYIFFHSIF